MEKIQFLSNFYMENWEIYDYAEKLRIGHFIINERSYWFVERIGIQNQFFCYATPEEKFDKQISDCQVSSGLNFNQIN